MRNGWFKRKAVQAQVAALPMRIERGRPQIMLITTRGRGAWMIPKGWPMRRREAHESAAAEAYEEAGVIGRVSEEALGAFGYAKRAGRYRVSVYRLDVECVLDVWPERRARRRAWFDAVEAAILVANPELARLIRAAAYPATPPRIAAISAGAAGGLS